MIRSLKVINGKDMTKYVLRENISAKVYPAVYISEIFFNISIFKSVLQQNIIQNLNFSI